MSNNAHELSNRLLNALDNNYNVSLRVLKILTLISEAEIWKRSPRACDTRFDVAIWPLGRLSLQFSGVVCLLWGKLVLVQVKVWGVVQSYAWKCGVVVDTWAVRAVGPLTSPAACRPSVLSAKCFAMWKYGIVPRVTFPVDFLGNMRRRRGSNKNVFFCSFWPYVSTYIRY